MKAWIFALALATTLSGTAGAYSLLVPTQVWQVTPVGIELTSVRNENTIQDGDYGHNQVIAAIDDAVYGWNQVAPVVGTTNLAVNYTIGDGTPTISFNDPAGICVMGCLAVTVTSYYQIGPDAFLSDADIFVSRKTTLKFTSELEDPTTATCNAEYYIEGIMVHEVGHAIGLNHSAVNGATMAAFASPCDLTNDHLDADDIAGADFLY